MSGLFKCNECNGPMETGACGIRWSECKYASFDGCVDPEKNSAPDWCPGNTIPLYFPKEMIFIVEYILQKTSLEIKEGNIPEFLNPLLELDKDKLNEIIYFLVTKMWFKGKDKNLNLDQVKLEKAIEKHSIAEHNKYIESGEFDRDCAILKKAKEDKKELTEITGCAATPSIGGTIGPVCCAGTTELPASLDISYCPKRANNDSTVICNYRGQATKSPWTYKFYVPCSNTICGATGIWGDGTCKYKVTKGE
jgi:hypothetical protein